MGEDEKFIIREIIKLGTNDPKSLLDHFEKETNIRTSDKKIKDLMLKKVKNSIELLEEYGFTTLQHLAKVDVNEGRKFIKRQKLFDQPITKEDLKNENGFKKTLESFYNVLTTYYELKKIRYFKKESSPIWNKFYKHVNEYISLSNNHDIKNVFKDINNLLEGTFNKKDEENLEKKITENIEKIYANSGHKTEKINKMIKYMYDRQIDRILDDTDDSISTSHEIFPVKTQAKTEEKTQAKTEEKTQAKTEEKTESESEEDQYETDEEEEEEETEEEKQKKQAEKKEKEEKKKETEKYKIEIDKTKEEIKNYNKYTDTQKKKNLISKASKKMQDIATEIMDEIISHDRDKVLVSTLKNYLKPARTYFYNEFKNEKGKFDKDKLKIHIENEFDKKMTELRAKNNYANEKHGEERTKILREIRQEIMKLRYGLLNDYSYAGIKSKSDVYNYDFKTFQKTKKVVQREYLRNVMKKYEDDLFKETYAIDIDILSRRKENLNVSDLINTSNIINKEISSTLSKVK